MALYEVMGPDGTVYKVEGPDGATEQQVIQAAKRLKREEEISRLRSEADALASAPVAPSAPQTTFLGGIAEFAKGIPAGAIGLAETAAIGASALAPDEYEQSIRSAIGSTAETLRSPFEASEGYEDSVARKFGEATGSIVPFLATAPFGLPGLAVAGGLGVGAGAGEARVRAEEAGATPEEKETATQLGAGVGLSEIVPVAKFARALRLTKPAGDATQAVNELNSIVGRGKRILSTAGYEGVQEFAANTAQNLIERGIYNPEQGVFTGSGEALGYGAGVGGLTQAIADIIIGRRARGMKGTAEKAEESVPSAEDLIKAQTQDIVDATPESTTEVTPEDDMIRESAPGIDIAYPRAGQDVEALQAEAEAIRTGQPVPETVAPVTEATPEDAPEAPTVPPELELGEVAPPVEDTTEAPGAPVPPRKAPPVGFKQFGYDPVALEETGALTPIPVDAGGQVFATKKDAQKAKGSIAIPMKVSQAEGGFTLTPQTQGEIAANQKKGQRLAASLGVTGRPLTAEEFIAANGGLKRELAPDLRVDGNLPLGNRYLIAGKGKGLDEGRAAELLVEEGYMSPDENMFDVLNESIAGKPRYSMAGYNQLIEQRSLEAPETSAEPVSVRQQAEALGIDPVAIEEEVARREDLTPEQFEQAVESRLQQEIDQRRGQVSDEIDFFDVAPVDFKEDIPNEDWLAGKVEDAIEGGRNSFGVPRRMGSITGYFKNPVRVPVETLSKLPGQRGEQQNVRQDSLDYIRQNWDEVSKQPVYVEVDPFGKAWVSEGNHRIMVAKEKGIKDLPVEIRYFSGGQRKAGDLSPQKIMAYNRGDQEIDLLDIQPPQTEEFKTWSRNAPIVARQDALNYDFKTGKPFVAESVHGTNAEDFDVFNMEMGGSQTGAESATMGIFSTSSPEVAGEYAKNVGMGRWLASAMVGSKESDIAKESLKKSGQLDRITKEQDKLRKEVADISAQITQRAEEIITRRAPGILDNLSPDGKASFIRSAASAYRDTEKDIDNLFQQRDAKLEDIDKLDQEYSGMMFDEMSRQLPQRLMPLYVRMNNPKVYDAKGKTPAEFSLSDKIAEARKQGHDGVVFKNIADPSPIAVHYVSFNPQDIKSATGNRGTFDPSDPSIIADLNPGYAATGEVRDANDVDALNEDIRDQKIREYQSLRQRLAGIQRRRVEGESGITDSVMERALYRRASDLKDAIEASKPTRDTAEDFMARAAKALADGDIDREVYDVIDAMFKKNPKFLEGLRLSVVTAQGDAAGQFIPFARIIKLFKGSTGVMNPGTIRHEFAHSMEQMMPADVKKKIVDKWRDALSKEIETNKTPQAQKYYEAVLKFIENPTRETYSAAIKELPSYHYYQFLNPSEYWAINAEPLMKSYLGSGWQRFKMSMRGMLESIKKVLGINNQSEIYQAFKDIIDGDRKGSKMLVDYIRMNVPLYQIQHRNYMGVPTTQLDMPAWEMPPDVMTSKLFGALNKTAMRYKIVDKLADMRDAIKAIETKVGQIDDNLNPSDKETNFHGKLAYEQKKYLKQEVEPILQKMVASKITPQQYNAYALAKHAEERNRRVAEINPRFPDAGSGISTAKAKAYLERLPAEERTKLEELNSMIRDFIKKTQDLEVQYQLTDKQTIENGRKLYPNYVPLFRTELDYDQGGSGLGRGFDVRGPMSKRAVGSSRDIKDIFSSIIEQREKVLIRGEKDKVSRSLYALSIANPNPDFWLPINPDAIKDPAAFIEELRTMGLTEAEAANLMEEPKVPQVFRVKDPQTNQYREEVRYVSSPRAKISDNVLAMRVNGKNRYVIFNPNNERAARLAKSLKNLDAEELGLLTQQVGAVTRWIASMSTQYNPIFGIWNFARDLQSAALNLSTTPLKGKQSQVLSNAIRFVPGMYREYRAFRRGEEATGDTAKLLRRFLEAGAQTGYRDQFTRLEEKGTIVQRELEKLNPGNVRKVVNAVGGWLSDYNDVLENAVRLAAFKQAIDMGLSDQKAAVIAKNLTVNFNRKGANTPGFSALYAFFNAAVQGTVRMAETLTGPAGRKIVAGGLLLGVVQALVLRAFDFEEDEPTEFIKQKNLIIPTGDGGYLNWPMPLGFNFLPNIGRILTEMTFDGRTKARDRVVNLMEVMTDAFNPLGGAGFLQTISPTIIDPFVAIKENRDSFGRPISREDQATNPIAGYLRSRDNASEFSKLLAEALNYISGGTKYAPGIVSPTADDIDYVVGQYLGGVGREAQKFAQLGKSAFTGEEVEQYRIPLFGKIYGETTSPAAVSNNFYRTIVRMAEHEKEIKGRAKDGVSPLEYIEVNPESRLYQAANRIENQVSKLNRTIRELRAQDKDDPRIKLLEERKTEVMQMFLDRVDELYPNER